MKKTSNKGFSLVELIVVIAIMAIIAAIAIPAYSAYVDKANTAKDKQLIKDTQDALLYAAVSASGTVYKDVPNDSTIGIVSIVKYENGDTEWIAKDAAGNSESAAVSSTNVFAGESLLDLSADIKESNQGYIAPALAEAGLWGTSLAADKNDGMEKLKAAAILSSNFFGGSTNESTEAQVSDLVDNVKILVDAYSTVADGSGDQVVFNVAKAASGLTGEKYDKYIDTWVENTFSTINVSLYDRIFGETSVDGLAAYYGNTKAMVSFCESHAKSKGAEPTDGYYTALAKAFYEGTEKFKDANGSSGAFTAMQNIVLSMNAAMVSDDYSYPAYQAYINDANASNRENDAIAFIETLKIADEMAGELGYVNSSGGITEEFAGQNFFGEDGLVKKEMISKVEEMKSLVDNDVIEAAKAIMSASTGEKTVVVAYMLRVYKDSTGAICVAEITAEA